MARRNRRKFTDEFKAEVVDLCLRGDRSIGPVARDLDLTETAVREWVKEAKADRGEGPPAALTSSEREELRRLRREVRQLREDREILKKTRPSSQRDQIGAERLPDLRQRLAVRGGMRTILLLCSRRDLRLMSDRWGGGHSSWL